MVEWAVLTVTLLFFTTIALVSLREEIIKLYQSVFEAVQRDPDPRRGGGTP
jgi:hypothetical protein